MKRSFDIERSGRSRNGSGNFQAFQDSVIELRAQTANDDLTNFVPPFNFESIDREIKEKKRPEPETAKANRAPNIMDHGYNLSNSLITEAHYTEFSPSQQKLFNWFVLQLKKYVKMPLSDSDSDRVPNRAYLDNTTLIASILPELLALFHILQNSDFYWQSRLNRVDQEIQSILSQMSINNLSSDDNVELAKQITQLSLNILHALGYKFSLEPLEAEDHEYPLKNLPKLAQQRMRWDNPWFKVKDWGKIASKKPKHSSHLRFTTELVDSERELTKAEFSKELLKKFDDKLDQLEEFIVKPFIQFHTRPGTSEQAWLHASSSLPRQLVFNHNRGQPKEIRNARQLLMEFIDSIGKVGGVIPFEFSELKKRIQTWLDLTDDLFKVQLLIPAHQLNQIDFSQAVQQKVLSTPGHRSFSQKQVVHPTQVLNVFNLLHGYSQLSESNGSMAPGIITQVVNNEPIALSSKIRKTALGRDKLVYSFFRFEYLSPEDSTRFVKDLTQLVWEILFLYGRHFTSRENKTMVSKTR